MKGNIITYWISAQLNVLLNSRIQRKNPKKVNTFNFNFKSIQQMQSDEIIKYKKCQCQVQSRYVLWMCEFFFCAFIVAVIYLVCVIFFFLLILFYVCWCRARRSHICFCRISSTTVYIACALCARRPNGWCALFRIIFPCIYMRPTNGRDCFLFQFPITFKSVQIFWLTTEKAFRWKRMGQSKCVNSQLKNKIETQHVVRVRWW